MPFISRPERVPLWRSHWLTLGHGVRKSGRGPQQDGHVKLIDVTGLTSYDQYGDEAHQAHIHLSDFEGIPLNAVVVTEFNHHTYSVDQAKVFLTSLPIADALAVLDLHDLRSLIENALFCELKQGWFLGRFPKKTADVVRGYVFLMLTIFNLTNACCTETGQDWLSVAFAASAALGCCSRHSFMPLMTS